MLAKCKVLALLLLTQAESCGTEFSRVHMKPEVRVRAGCREEDKKGMLFFKL